MNDIKEKCETCSAESKYIYKEKQLCSDCVTKLAQRVVKNYFAEPKEPSHE